MSRQIPAASITVPSVALCHTPLCSTPSTPGCEHKQTGGYHEASHEPSHEPAPSIGGSSPSAQNLPCHQPYRAVLGQKTAGDAIHPASPIPTSTSHTLAVSPVHLDRVRRHRGAGAGACCMMGFFIHQLHPPRLPIIATTMQH